MTSAVLSVVTAVGGPDLRARVGDQLLVPSPHPEDPARDALILEVRRPDGSPPYRVRWTDTGHVSMVLPGRGAHVRPYSSGPTPRG